MNGISIAINCVGSQAELARKISEVSGERITSQMIHNWKLRANVPPDFAPFFEQVTRGKVLADDVCSRVPWYLIRGKAA